MVTVSSTPLPRTVDEVAIHAFRTQLQGELLAPGDPGYHDARRVFNAMIDRYPALIARAQSAEDVRRAVLFARDHDLPLSVKGGGHNVAGSAVCDGGLMLDLSLMKGIQVDPERRIAVAQSGLTIGELDRATQVNGLATPLGTVSVTGIAGLTLGGGISWLNGKYGLACDNVIAADVVTADGELLRASVDENSDLYWAIRGGSGNFGVVTAFVYQLHPVGPLFTGSLVFPPAQARDALRFYHAFSQTVPDDLSTLGSLTTDDAGQTVMSVTYSWCGPFDEGERALRPLRTFGTPIEDSVDVLTYCALQQVINERFPAGRKHYWKTNFLTDLSDEAIDVMCTLRRSGPRRHTSPPRLEAAARPSVCSTSMAPRPGSTRPRRRFRIATPTTISSSFPSGPIPPTPTATSPGRGSSSRRCVPSRNAPCTSTGLVWKERTGCARPTERIMSASHWSRRVTTRRTSFGPIRTSNPRPSR